MAKVEEVMDRLEKKEQKQYICNPIVMKYRYQFNRNPMHGSIDINREAADPSMIYFKGKYYIFASMTLSVLVSDDLVNWKSKKLPDNLPLYGYAPDARVCGEYVYFCANEGEEVCHFYRTKDILQGPYEKMEGSFAFHDPNLFVDDDGRMYFYWGLSCKKPIYGVELDPITMKPIGKKRELINGNPLVNGFERIGEDNTTIPCSEKELQIRYQNRLKKSGIKDGHYVSKEMEELLKDMLRDAPYIEGVWMNKFGGKYYLQYAAPGTQFNVYCDGVYVAEYPLGPFYPADNNPYSYHPGSFLPGAGHGSTMEDKYGNLWHAATMRISVNHQFERRIGLWRAGIDAEGELFCNQRYGDWPMPVKNEKNDPWTEPEWYLLSYNKPIKASSYTKEHEPEKAVNEDVRKWWQAAGRKAGEWIEVDLEAIYDIYAIQINFADDKYDLRDVVEKNFADKQQRYIDTETTYTRWILEGSSDGKTYFIIRDNSKAKTDLPHDLIVNPEGDSARYLRLTICEVPYNQKPCISGLRVFGKGNGSLPDVPQYEAERTGDLDMLVTIEGNGAVGYNILWGTSPEKLYHSYLTYESTKRIGALVKGIAYFVCVDAFNESGITKGKILYIPAGASASEVGTVSVPGI